MRLTTDSVLDSRIIDQKIEELEAKLKPHRVETDLDDSEFPSHWWTAASGEVFTDDADEDEVDYLRWLKEIKEAAEGHPSWTSGMAIIPVEKLEAYFQEYVEGVEGIDVTCWPFDHIDWEAAIDAASHDYKQESVVGPDQEQYVFWYRA